MTYDQHEARKRQALDFHQRLSVERKEACEPKTDIEPMIFVVTSDKQAYHGTPGPMTWDYLGGRGVFESMGMTSMLIIYAQSVLQLMAHEDIEPALIMFSNEGYVKTYPLPHDAELPEELKRHRLGDFAQEFRDQAETRVREALMTNVVSFPAETDDDDEPTYSSVVQPFLWTDGGQLVLDPLPEEREEGEIATQRGGMLMIGVRAGTEDNHTAMIKMIWEAVQERRARRPKEAGQEKVEADDE